MGMYVARPDLVDPHDLNQGDILTGMLRPKILTEKNFCVRTGSKVTIPAPAETLKALDKNLRVMSELERIDALVISNSCDNTGNNPLLLVPVRPLKLDDKEPAHKQWDMISQAATGTANPKLFYLPAEPGLGPAARSEAQLHTIFSVSHEFVQRCVAEAGTKRVCGLTAEALRHLQWAVGVVFSRDAREDYDWPSRDDLALKLAYYDHHIEKGHARKAEYVKEREHVRKLLGLDDAQLVEQPEPAPPAPEPPAPEPPAPEPPAQEDNGGGGGEPTSG